MIDRRGLLGLGGAAAAAPLGFVGGASASLPQIQRYATLGRTGLEVSEISSGAASSSDADLVRYALERDATFFDAAESYRFGWSEEALGEGLRGVRDRVVPGSKTRARADDAGPE